MQVTVSEKLIFGPAGQKRHAFVDGGGVLHVTLEDETTDLFTVSGAGVMQLFDALRLAASNTVSNTAALALVGIASKQVKINVAGTDLYFLVNTAPL